jgi:cyclopropane-fatty-acyl-phospholipid synthase
VAIETAAANRQHYELPAEFFALVLGPRRKYSACVWPAGIASLAEAELASLEQVCHRAGIADGQTVLDLGCGWGSFSLYAAERFPKARFLAVSNSRSQATYIESKRLPNLQVVTADVNAFRPERTFDRIVSIEMLEHVRNHPALFARIAEWLEPEGRCFAHVFCHRRFTYPFERDGDRDWMARHFFTGGLMPSAALFGEYDDDLSIEEQWSMDGTHYQRTAAAWRANLERRRREVMPILETAYGGAARRWYHRWRLFFLACEELFGFAGGEEWFVAHYLFRKAPVAAPLAASGAGPS